MQKQNRTFTFVATFLFSFLAILVVWSISSYTVREAREKRLYLEMESYKNQQLQEQENQKKQQEIEQKKVLEKEEKLDFLAEKEIDKYLAKDLESSGGWIVESEEEWYKVLYVYDGDTIAVDMGGEFKKVRLIGIDAPETGEKYRDKECYGKEASKEVEKLLIGSQVRLQKDSSQADKDKYGRLLRYVYLENGTMLNQLLIEKGFATEYTYRESRYRYQTEFRNAERKAKKEKVGLWAKCIR